MAPIRAGLLLLVVVLMAACGTSNQSGSTLSTVELKYRLLAKVGPIDYCDPDAYPLAREVTPPYVAQRLSDIASRDPQNYQAIVSHYHMSPPLTESEQQTVYKDYKQLSALNLMRNGTNYDFRYLVSLPGKNQTAEVTGTITPSGLINIQSQKPSLRICPICLAASTAIATPNGQLQVTEIRPGMLIWTADASGHRLQAVVLKVGSMEAPLGHEVVHLVMADGREVWVSPGHPTGDGRRVGDLAPGDAFDGSVIRVAVRIPYVGKTYDLLPSGPTGTYWANGILLASTLGQ